MFLELILNQLLGNMFGLVRKVCDTAVDLSAQQSIDPCR